MKKRREWETEKYLKLSRKTQRVSFKNKFINTFLESGSDEDEGNVT